MRKRLLSLLLALMLICSAGIPCVYAEEYKYKYEMKTAVYFNGVLSWTDAKLTQNAVPGLDCTNYTEIYYLSLYDADGKLVNSKSCSRDTYLYAYGLIPKSGKYYFTACVMITYDTMDTGTGSSQVSVQGSNIVTSSVFEYTDTTPPSVEWAKNGTNRTGATTATAKFSIEDVFSSNNLRMYNYYYAVVESGAAAPASTAYSEAISCSDGRSNTISLTNLPYGGVDVYLIVEDADGNQCEPIMTTISDGYAYAIQNAACSVPYATAHTYDDVTDWFHTEYTAYLETLLEIELNTEFVVDEESFQSGDPCTPGSFTFSVQVTLKETEEEIISLDDEVTMTGAITSTYEGHSWVCASNGDGTHTHTCQNCGAETTEDCAIVDNVCQDCGYVIVDAETPAVSGITGSNHVYYESGKTFTLTVNVTEPESGELSYQWYTNSSSATTGGTAIAGATSATYSAAMTAAMRDTATYYYCVVTNTDDSVNGEQTAAAAASIKVQPTVPQAPTIQTISGGGTYNYSMRVTLSVSATVGSGTLTYQWYSNTKESNTGGTAISGATSSSYRLTLDRAALGTKYYYCVVTNTGTASDPVSLSIASDPIAVTTSLFLSTTHTDTQTSTSGRLTLAVDSTVVLPANSELATEDYTATAQNLASILLNSRLNQNLIGITTVNPTTLETLTATGTITSTGTTIRIGDVLTVNGENYIVFDIANTTATLIRISSGKSYTLTFATGVLRVTTDAEATISTTNKVVQIGGTAYVQCYSFTKDGTKYTFLYTTDGAPAGYYVGSGNSTAYFYADTAPASSALDAADGVIKTSATTYLANTDSGVLVGDVVFSTNVSVQSDGQTVETGGTLSLTLDEMEISGKETIVGHIGSSSVDTGTISNSGMIELGVHDLSPVIAFTVSEYTVRTTTVELTVSEVANASNTTTSPKTGDENQLGLWVCLLTLSGIGICAFAYTAKKRKVS